MSRDKEYDEYCLKAGIENRNTGTVRLGDLKHMNFQELEAMVLHQAQQIKDLAAHLLELKMLVTPMMDFKRSGWVGLTGDEIEDLPKGGTWGEAIRAAEAILREKNGG